MPFFLHVDTRRARLAEHARHPNEAWITHMGRSAIDENPCICANIGTGRDSQFCDDLLAPVLKQRGAIEAVLNQC
jgi:hypothetical protein